MKISSNMRRLLYGGSRGESCEHAVEPDYRTFRGRSQRIWDRNIVGGVNDLVRGVEV